MSKPTRAIVVVRTRIAEDELAASGATQYVLLGAGLDTFAYRNPFPHVRVFEVDQPDTQALKKRAARRGGYRAAGEHDLRAVRFFPRPPRGCARRRRL